MSAYICNTDHFVFLVAAATSRQICLFQGLHMTWRHNGVTHRLNYGDTARELEVANMLAAENTASVNARYNETTSPPTITRGDQPFLHFPPVQVIKSCDCLEYQSCEHDGWEASEAKAFLDALRKKAWHALPGYDDATWGAPSRKP